MQKRATLKDVARSADVSVMTVSNVINGKFRHVTEKTRRRAEEAIKALGYRPDPAGRSLRLSRRFSIGMVIVDPNPTFIADAFTTNLVAGLSNCLSRHGYGLLLQGTTFGDISDLIMLRQSRVDGICAFCSGSPAQRLRVYAELAKHNEPVVVFQDQIDTDLQDALWLRQDDFADAALLTKHVLQSGATDLVYLTVRDRWPALDASLRGIRSCLRRHPTAKLRTVAASSAHFDAVQEALAADVETNDLPHGILAGNDQIAIAAQNWLMDHKVAIPEKVRVTGFNAFEFWRFARPALTTIRSPAYEMGERGGHEILQRLATGKFGMREIVLPVAFQSGESA